jgi:hypothetical protein
MNLKHTLSAGAVAMLLGSGTAFAANAPNTLPAPSTQSDRIPASAERDQLQQKLQAAANRADYAKLLESDGYRIAAINEDKKDYLEYEVVKGDRSFEVQLSFKDGAARADKVDVAPNMWRADATKRMLEDSNYRHIVAVTVDPDGRYSDRRYLKSWTDEKARLEKALPASTKVADLRSSIEAMGYKVTAVNDRERDYVELEIVKGENSYEVQIDVDAATGLAKDVDVTSNLWEADATDRATDRASDAKKD